MAAYGSPEGDANLGARPSLGVWLTALAAVAGCDDLAVPEPPPPVMAHVTLSGAVTASFDSPLRFESASAGFGLTIIRNQSQDPVSPLLFQASLKRDGQPALGRYVYENAFYQNFLGSRVRVEGSGASVWEARQALSPVDRHGSFTLEFTHLAPSGSLSTQGDAHGTIDATLPPENVVTQGTVLVHATF
jgi:hypothetical protein